MRYNLNKHILSAMLLLATVPYMAQGQELQAKVTVLTQRLSSSVNKNIFNTLQTQLTNLLNSRKWTGDTYQTSEKIQCNFLVNIANKVSDDVYQATITVQAARPVFNSSYQTALINFQDADFTFKYIEYQPVDFNENQVQGTDALTANITATFAYYVYMILGLDYDSFSPKGGVPYFTKAQNIVNNAPEDRNIAGWKSFDGVRNRYWLANNIMNPKYNILHDVIYNYYRSGLDSLYSNETTARAGALDALTRLQAFNQENPATMFLQVFVQNRSSEFMGIFKNADPIIKQRAVEILSQVDVANSNNYKTQLR
jgi:hypothetical protein